jgi:hypothetical protein
MSVPVGRDVRVGVELTLKSQIARYLDHELICNRPLLPSLTDIKWRLPRALVASEQSSNIKVRSETVPAERLLCGAFPRYSPATGCASYWHRRRMLVKAGLGARLSGSGKLALRASACQHDLQ